MIRLTLPYPISANRYWRPVKLGAHISIVPTKEAKDYRKTVAGLCFAAGVARPIAGRVAVTLQLYPHRPLDWKTRQRKHGAAWDDTVQCIDLTNVEEVQEAMEAEQKAGRGGHHTLFLSLLQNGSKEADLRKAFYDQCGLDNSDSKKRTYTRVKSWACKQGFCEFSEGYVLTLKGKE